MVYNYQNIESHHSCLGTWVVRFMCGSEDGAEFVTSELFETLAHDLHTVEEEGQGTEEG